mmetsp:Transcript_10015/g.11491  ORF Transcript_10015/g.11491 Transcript_10015/m.11491 type:complete len:287 (+) Transcript_10015:51-911(+)|eukprot:CAMPEP_0194369466 /NCGR_PEP_ID=MMETSP0174-20130528/17774_1 /TAXON_ID=216777 /ORGANISM="Proboscia alata, Strain PI-D3" /LENGTH=286 /DNA_ID=CAMNT_0039146427 /DNA_START=31 /DNA_END=891 /DNA_ORIENTATION=-
MPPNEKERPLIVVVGAGSKHGTKNSDLPDSVRWGLGGALAIPFAEKGYDVVLMARREEVLDDVRKAVEAVQQANNYAAAKVLCVKCDVTDEESVEQAFEYVKSSEHFGADSSTYIDLVMFNVAPPYPSNFKFEGWGKVILPHQIDFDDMNMQYDTQVNGLIRICKQVMPGMIDRKRGCILLSGESCCNLHGGFEFGSVAPARAALRSLGQSMFQAYGPMGIHVCNINIGGIIDSPKTRSWTEREELTKPNEIAEQFLNIYKQKSTVWSYEVSLSPGFSAHKVNMSM